jgi:carbamoyl-phosphate synthase/aspartate carbamoyltransferase/dihydroorotase
MKLPGMVDVHVHLRVPGGEHKEDFRTGSAAALAGGITTLMAMPNTFPPIVTIKDFSIAQETANRQSLCDVFMYAGASAEHLDQLNELAKLAPALKLYMDQTYGPLQVHGLDNLLAVFEGWPASKVICIHAEQTSIAAAIGALSLVPRPIHFCHVSRKEEIELIAAAKKQGLPVTCEVTPHHLFLTEEDATRLGSLADMRPTLAEQRDVDALWSHINTTIDCIATDHAPHTLQEKQSETPPPGVPGLESSLPLMLTAAAQGRLSYERLVELMHFNPRRIFSLPAQPETWVEIDPLARYQFPDYPLYTKCGWTPFAGFPMQGKIRKVIFKGRTVVNDGVVHFPN